MDERAATAFASSWIDAWNSHDLDAVVAHFSPEAVFSSPLVAELMGEPTGTLTGHRALRAYWQAGLDRFPSLRFELVDVHAGADCVVVRYRNQRGRQCSEVAFFDATGLVVRGAAAYGAEPA